MMSEGLSVADALALNNSEKNDNDGMFGGGGYIWIFFLFFLLAWGNGGFGMGNGNNNAATQGMVTRVELNDGFMNQDLQNSVRNIGNGICDGFYAQNTNILNGFAGVQN